MSVQDGTPLRSGQTIRYRTERYRVLRTCCRPKCDARSPNLLKLVSSHHIAYLQLGKEARCHATIVDDDNRVKFLTKDECVILETNLGHKIATSANQVHLLSDHVDREMSKVAEKKVAISNPQSREMMRELFIRSGMARGVSPNERVPFFSGDPVFTSLAFLRQNAPELLPAAGGPGASPDASDQLYTECVKVQSQATAEFKKNAFLALYAGGCPASNYVKIDKMMRRIAHGMVGAKSALDLFENLRLTVGQVRSLTAAFFFLFVFRKNAVLNDIHKIDKVMISMGLV